MDIDALKDLLGKEWWALRPGGRAFGIWRTNGGIRSGTHARWGDRPLKRPLPAEEKAGRSCTKGSHSSAGGPAQGLRLPTDHGPARREGILVNKKRVHRIWKAEGLQVPRRRPNGRGRKGEVIRKAEHINHVRTYDFPEDRTERGGVLRMLTVLDEFTRGRLAILVGRSIPAAKVIDTMEWLALARGLPAYIRSDNAPEFVAKAVQRWLKEKHCKTIYIEPGSLWEIP